MKCNVGHAHRTQELVEDCEDKTHRSKRNREISKARYLEAFYLRKSGQLYREIGKHFGVTPSRARQLAWTGARKQKSMDYFSGRRRPDDYYYQSGIKKA